MLRNTSADGRGAYGFSVLGHGQGPMATVLQLWEVDGAEGRGRQR